MPPQTLRKWMIVFFALLSGTGVSAGLLITTRAEAGREELFYVVARDLPAGSPLGADSLLREPMRLGKVAASAFRAGAADGVAQGRASHDLRAGQLLQRADLAAGSEDPDRRLVWLALKESPPAAPGDRVDLLLLGGGGERLSVVPFARSVPVHSTGPGSVVVAVSSRQAPAFVYAAASGRLVAVSSPAGASGGGDEQAVASLEQARALAWR